MTANTARKHTSAPAKSKPTAQRAIATIGTQPESPPGSVALSRKLGELLKLVRRKTGASIEELVRATGWQAHSVRGAISGTLRKRLGLAVECNKADGVTRYRVAA